MVFLHFRYNILGPSWGRLGVILGPSWGLSGPSWRLLGPSWGHLGASWGLLEPLGVILGPLGKILGPLEAISEPLGAILGPSWGLLGPPTPSKIWSAPDRRVVNNSCVLLPTEASRSSRLLLLTPHGFKHRRTTLLRPEPTSPEPTSPEGAAVRACRPRHMARARGPVAHMP